MDFQQRALIPQLSFEDSTALPPDVTRGQRLTKQDRAQLQRARTAKLKVELARGYAGLVIDLETDLGMQAEQRMDETVSYIDAHVQGSAGEPRNYMAVLGHEHIKQRFHQTADMMDWFHDQAKEIGRQMLRDPEPTRGLLDWRR
jgi:hypothetical protein